MAARGRDILRISVQAMYQVGIIGTQRRGQLAIATTDMDDDATLDTGGAKNFVGRWTSGGRTGDQDGRQ